jgi:hypothetical protein
VQLEQFIQYIVHHNAQIIEALVGLIVLFTLFLAYRSFLSAKAAELSPAGAAPSLGELEDALKKILEKANGLPTAAAGAAGGEATAPLLEEIAELKKNLEVKQGELEQLKSVSASPAPAGDAGLSGEERSKLESQIKELQGKLSEYEIISEDIADLSFYKEENAKLQKELASLKNGAPAAAVTGATAAPPAAAPSAPEVPPAMAEAPAVEAPPVEKKPEPEIVGKTRAPLETEPEAPSVVPATADALAAAIAPAADVDLSERTPPITSAGSDPGGDEDIMKEFAAAVEEQKARGVGDPTPAAVPAADAGVDFGEMDMDKMLAEASNLDAAKADESANALEATLDSNKLLEEAASMEAIKPEDTHLMGQFEKFVKKGGA